MQSNSVAVYFEAEILHAHPLYDVAVGIIHKDCALKKHPGLSNMSFGYTSGGVIYINRAKVHFLIIVRVVQFRHTKLAV